MASYIFLTCVCQPQINLDDLVQLELSVRQQYDSSVIPSNSIFCFQALQCIWNLFGNFTCAYS